MSNQSGIIADQQLLNVLNTAPVSEKTKTLIVTAKLSHDNTVVEVNEQYDNFDSLLGDLSDEEPYYIFIKDENIDDKHYDFVSYVPDNAPVKFKMLYASTKNTIVRQIGTNLINQQILCTDLHELKDFFTKDIKEESEKIGIVDDNILTESERIELEIAQQQREFQQQVRGQPLVSQNNGIGGQLSFNVITDDSLVEDLKKDNVLSFHIDNEQVKILKKFNIDKPNDMKISQEHPSYTIYRNNELYYFIYSCPSGSKVKDRMIYAANKSGFVKYLQDLEHINFENIIEIGEPDELEISLIHHGTAMDIAQEKEKIESEQKNNSLKFNKPKGPTRRRRN